MKRYIKYMLLSLTDVNRSQSLRKVCMTLETQFIVQTNYGQNNKQTILFIFFNKYLHRFLDGF